MHTAFLYLGAIQLIRDTLGGHKVTLFLINFPAESIKPLKKIILKERRSEGQKSAKKVSHVPLLLRFVIICQKEKGKKATRKMLMNLTTDHSIKFWHFHSTSDHCKEQKNDRKAEKQILCFASSSEMCKNIEKE